MCLRTVCSLALASSLLTLSACGKERLVAPATDATSGSELAKPAGKTALQGEAKVEVKVVREGVPLPAVEVEFSRSVSGRPADYRWKGVTDEEGWAEIRISSEDPQFRREGASGYYLAQAVDSVSKEILGRWGSIPINDGEDSFFHLPIGGRAQRLSEGMIDRGSFVLEADPDSLVSYSGGGGLFLLSLVPGQTFDGQVSLSLAADTRLNAELRTTILTRSEPITEVTIRPDSLTPPAIFSVLVVAFRAGAADTIPLGVSTLVDTPPGSDLIDKNGAYVARFQEEFAAWLQRTHPDLGIQAGQDWFDYQEDPGDWDGHIYVGGGIRVYLNSVWEMKIRTVVTPGAPFWMLLRKRGEREPLLAAKRDPDGTIFEIPIDEFN